MLRGFAAIQSDTPSDLITIDKDYLDRVTLRRSLIAQQGRTVHGCTPAGEAALREVYTYLFQNYLPTRYPSIFSTSPDGLTLYNTATGCALPANPPSPLESLRNIGETVEEDMFILQQTPEGHRSTAFVCCFPAGFNGSEKLDKLLREIHAPVPGYEKIGASMERFFSKLEVGKSAKRMNVSHVQNCLLLFANILQWSIQLDHTLFKCQSHDTPEDQIDPMAHIDASKGFARIELQTLTRLPQTRFILFSFKTYLYPLKDIKDEGLGPDLADAIEGLDKGNAPGMWVYKGSKRWAGPVCEYLRS